MSSGGPFAAALAEHRLGHWDEARRRYLEIIARGGERAEVHYNLGLACRASGRLGEALEAYARALALRPEFPQAENNMGSVLHLLWRLDEAAGAFRRAVALEPSYAEAWNNLGTTLKGLARMEEAVPCFRRSIELQPDNPSLHSNFLYALHFHPGCDAAALAREHALWAERHAAPLGRNAAPHANERTAGRRLRVGYVSSAFREHCQSFFTLPLLSGHDRSRFEVFCYSDVGSPDALTGRLRAGADAWRNIAGMSDEQAAGAIRGDRIDILVDLMLHMPNNRLLAFARRPAPVQATWLGYPGTTGMSAVDYRLSDPFLDPEWRTEDAYSERTLRLPETFWCYDPLSARPAAWELPARRAGHVTFGCLNNFSKVNDAVLGLWARVLAAVPGSRLVLLAPRGEARRRALGALGVDEARVEFADFLPRPAYLESFRRIDVCLDTFPYNGHTTSLDAFWLGVPVVTLCGQSAVSRAGLSQATNLGVPELVARSPEEFVRIATGLAGAPQRLEALRAGLRGRFTGSPLADGARFARGVEASYRQMWERWCA
jgi:protein O-GlcNAc transferase